MITVYGYSPSGNCHKLRMLLSHLRCDYHWVETDSAHGATRTPEFLAKNPNGKVPSLIAMPPYAAENTALIAQSR